MPRHMLNHPPSQTTPKVSPTTFATHTCVFICVYTYLSSLVSLKIFARWHKSYHSHFPHPSFSTSLKQPPPCLLLPQPSSLLSPGSFSLLSFLLYSSSALHLVNGMQLFLPCFSCLFHLLGILFLLTVRFCPHYELNEQYWCPVLSSFS